MKQVIVYVDIFVQDIVVVDIVEVVVGNQMGYVVVYSWVGMVVVGSLFEDFFVEVYRMVVQGCVFYQLGWQLDQIRLGCEGLSIVGK